MKVVQLISSSGLYGAESVILTLSRALGDLDCDCIIAAFEDSRDPHIEIANEARKQGFEVEIVPCAGKCDWKAVDRLIDLLDRRSPDLLHTHGYKANIYGYVASRFSHTPVVSTCHNWAGSGWKMRVYAALDRLILRRFGGVAAVSESVAQILRESGIAHPRYVCNGIDTGRSADSVGCRKTGADRCDQVVGFVGRLVPEKGGDLLIQAARPVIAARPRTAFLFIGEGPARAAWEGAARQLGVAENVLFPGRSEDMRQAYSFMDVLVLPSRLEATPMCLLEAMAMGIPVVATRVGDVPNLIEDGVTGILVEPEDMVGLCEAILAILGDAPLAQKLSRQAQQLAKDRFSSTSMARAYADLYDEVLAGRRGPRPVPVMQ